MTLGIECGCGETVVFMPDDTGASYLERGCDGCGRIYRLKVKEVFTPEELRE